MVYRASSCDTSHAVLHHQLNLEYAPRGHVFYILGAILSDRSKKLFAVRQSLDCSSAVCSTSFETAAELVSKTSYRAENSKVWNIFQGSSSLCSGSATPLPSRTPAKPGYVRHWEPHAGGGYWCTWSLAASCRSLSFAQMVPSLLSSESRRVVVTVHLRKTPNQGSTVTRSSSTTNHAMKGALNIAIWCKMASLGFCR